MKIWLGMDLPAWLRLLARNRFCIGVRYIPWAMAVTSTAAFHSLARPLHDLLYRPRVRRARLAAPPIFVLGHERSGTTYLHQLLATDPRFTYPTTMQSLNPTYLFLSRRTVGLMRRLVPEHRESDGMVVNIDSPQEDEFALCNLGMPSPYARMAFPGNPDPYPGALELEGLSPRQLARWKTTWLLFLQSVALMRPGRLVLKSPPHMCRLKTILEVFPEARFIHLVRSPYQLIPSAIHHRRTMYESQRLHHSMPANLEEEVFQSYRSVFGRFQQTVSLIPPGHLYDVHYEKLVRDPIGQMETIYQRLDLGEFHLARPSLEAHLARTSEFEARSVEPDARLRARIERECAPVIKQYGYDR